MHFTFTLASFRSFILHSHLFETIKLNLNPEVVP